MLDEVLLVHIIDGDMQMLIVFDQGGFIMELPVDHGNNVSDVAMGQSLGSS